ncbi:alkaline phosphatase family protein [Streptomyces sp. NPDC050485]|uniref:alkaline phosphatase family protein n=1 Tax=Streptomyces sp. NPDC050485 TaxID=3365617 RepID=UPI003791AB17
MQPARDTQLPPSVHEALKRPPRKGGLQAVKHVVFLMQENRSFDHYFGTFPGVRGFHDRNAITLRDGYSVFDQPRSKGDRVSPHPLPADGSEDTSTLHDWATGHQAWHEGWHDAWIDAKQGPYTMSYYERDGVPFYHALADAFTICDAYHCSVLSETTSNRNYLFSGYGGYEPDGSRVTGAAAHDREDSPGAYQWPSYPQWLEANGKTWKVYQEWDNFYDNNLEFFAAFKNIFRTALQKSDGLWSTYKSLYGFYQGLQTQQSSSDRDAMLRRLQVGVEKLSPGERRLYDRGLYRCAPRPATTTGLVAELRSDIRQRQLPQVSYLVPPTDDSEHPGNSYPKRGQKIVYQVLDALAADPEVWDSTVLFLSYDENDGLFDHVPPPVPPPSETDEYVGSEPLGLGIRVPMIVVSPWTAGGYVCSQVFDHTSQVRFLEKWLGVPQPSISRWRRTVAGDLTSAFDFERTQPLPPAPGERRRARALPYQPDAYATLDTSRRLLLLSLSNSGSASAHLTLYPYKRERETPRHFDVQGHSVTDVQVHDAEGNYRFTLTGPNGFRREFSGSLEGAGAPVDVTSETDEKARRLLIRARNNGDVELTMYVTADHYVTGGQGTADPYHLKPGTETVIDWNTEVAEGWYDLKLVLGEDGTFQRRLMGHLENGSESVSG